MVQYYHMFDFYEKRKIQHILFSIPTIFVITVLAIWTSFAVYDRYVVSKEIEAKLEERYKELKRLEERAHILEGKVAYLADDRGLEEELRNRFDIAKEGEQVVILLDSEPTETLDEVNDKKGNGETPGASFWDFVFFWR